ncbi:MAG: hypothetical protein WD988_01805 [Candidatus Curtissbacteria bacterium]
MNRDAEPPVPNRDDEHYFPVGCEVKFLRPLAAHLLETEQSLEYLNHSSAISTEVLISRRIRAVLSMHYDDDDVYVFDLNRRELKFLGQGLREKIAIHSELDPVSGGKLFSHLLPKQRDNDRILAGAFVALDVNFHAVSGKSSDMGDVFRSWAQ